MSVIREVEAERRRQITAEGWTFEHDDTHINCELATAAACYAVGHTFERRDQHPKSSYGFTRRLWPWSMQWWKPKDRRRNLIRAAALLVAEIERIDRASAPGGSR